MGRLLALPSAYLYAHMSRPSLSDLNQFILSSGSVWDFLDPLHVAWKELQLQGRGALTQPTGQQGGEHLIEMFNMLFLFLKLKLFKANICVNFGALLGLKFQLMQCYDAVL